jgi:hypothetical protein
MAIYRLSHRHVAFDHFVMEILVESASMHTLIKEIHEKCLTLF